MRLGTRASALARWQAEWVASELARFGVRSELVFIATQGDRATEPLGAIGGQGVFTKEIQRALLAGTVDLAVHSLKDLPTEPVPGLTLAAVPSRESNRDVLVVREPGSLATLPAGARIGTGSLRRRAQLLYARPDLEILEIRGNVDTRLRKLDAGQYDALVLAEAGLRRLGWAERITEVLPLTLMLPAVGQGALGIETRTDAALTRRCLGWLDDAATRSAVLAERAVLAQLRAGCHAPVGAWGRLAEGVLQLDAVVLSSDGTARLAAAGTGPADQPERLGEQIAQQLLEAGAERLILATRPIAAAGDARD